MNSRRIGLALFLLFALMVPAAAQFSQSPAQIGPATPETGARFGDEMATGDVNGDGIADLVVGVPYADVGGRRDAGQVVIYFGGRGFEGKAGATLQAPDPVDDAHFGAVLALGNVGGDATTDILVGAPGATAGDQTGAGRAYAFFGGASLDMKAPDATLQAPTPQKDARFGVSIAIGEINGGGADIVVGANLVDVTTGTAPSLTTYKDAGEAYVFFGPGFNANTTTLQAATPQAGARFGTAVAAVDLNGDPTDTYEDYDDVVVAGDRTNVVSGTITLYNVGEAVVYFGAAPASGSTTQLDTTVDVTLHGVTLQSGASFGRVMVKGDINGDGIKDVVIGAPLFDASNNVRDSGEAYVIQGSTSITGTPAANATVRGQTASATYYGTSLALGDIDGDGLLDTIGGGPGAEVNGQPGAGRAFVLLSGVALSGVLTSSITLQSPIPQVDAHFGQAVAAADLNNDGLVDVIVSAPYEDAGDVPDAGRIYIFYGNAPMVPFIAGR